MHAATRAIDPSRSRPARLPLARSCCRPKPRSPDRTEAAPARSPPPPDSCHPRSKTPAVAPDRSARPPRSISLPRSSREGRALPPISGSSSASDRDSRLSRHLFWSSLQRWCWSWSSPAWIWSLLLARVDLVSASASRACVLAVQFSVCFR